MFKAILKLFETPESTPAQRHADFTAKLMADAARFNAYFRAHHIVSTSHTLEESKHRIQLEMEKLFPAPVVNPKEPA